MAKNIIQRVGAAVSVATVMASSGAWAQVGEHASTTVVASGAMNAKTVRKANRELRRKVYAALAKHKEIDAGSISVTAKGGAISLDGTVTETSQIETVSDVARKVAGVTSVTNKITVQRPLGQ